MNTRARRWCRKVYVVLVLGFGLVISWRAGAAAGTSWPGLQPDGATLLPNLWSLRPAGQQLAMGDFPVNIAVHPKGRYVAVLHAGYGKHELVVVDVDRLQVTARSNVVEAFYGLEFSSSGERLYVSGASSELVRVMQFSPTNLAEAGTIRLRPVEQRGIPAGLAISRDERSLWVASVLGQCVDRVDVPARKVLGHWVFDAGSDTVVTLAPEGLKSLDELAIEKRANAQVDLLHPDASFPYGCRVDERAQRLYVSLWARSRVAVIDLRSNEEIARWPTEEHPNEMALTRDGSRLYVANANRNTVSVLDTATGRCVESLSAAPWRDAPPGSTPNSLALSPDEKTLFVANACNNAVAVFDVERKGRSRALGMIPVGWYPTSVRVMPNGRTLVVANGKGGGSKANPKGPAPGRPKQSGTVDEYIGGLMQGSLSVIELPARRHLERWLRPLTAEVLRCAPAAPNQPHRQHPGGNHPIPRTLGEKSPIKYCVYIIKENRTYDQVFGDLPQGRGDPSLCLFPEEVTPNHHQLAREFVLLDNFYVESEVSADGHEWTMGAYATDFVEKTWPLSYGHNGRGKYVYPSEGRFKVAEPAGGYLWDRARAADVSYRSYGEFIANGKTPRQPGTTRIKALEGHFDPWFRGFDMDYSDLDRADRFMAEWKRLEAEGSLPRLQIVRLPNDHTAGTVRGKPTPRAYVAENDLALGRVVEMITRSKHWPETAIFVVEDDAQNGADHVDAHRTVAFAISPYSRRRVVDSTPYTTSSMLRTIELILGLSPMSQFDAVATPMHASFQAVPDLTPYAAVPARINLQEKNLADAWGAEESEKMNWSKEDAADDLRLNEIVWRSVKGSDSSMPAPRRAAFVFSSDSDDGDDD